MSLPKTAVAAIILGVVLLLALESQGCNKGALPSPDTTTEAGSRSRRSGTSGSVNRS